MMGEGIIMKTFFIGSRYYNKNLSPGIPSVTSLFLGVSLLQFAYIRTEISISKPYKGRLCLFLPYFYPIFTGVETLFSMILYKKC